PATRCPGPADRDRVFPYTLSMVRGSRVSRPVIPFGDRITPLLEERVEALYRHIPRALAGEEEPVHQVRVSSRRLRAAPPILASKPEGRRVRRAIRILREVTRAAGRSRDLDVSVALLEDRLPKRGGRSREQATLLTRLRATRARSRGRLAFGLIDLDI